MDVAGQGPTIAARARRPRRGKESQEHYCPVMAMLGKAAPVTYDVIVSDTGVAPEHTAGGSHAQAGTGTGERGAFVTTLRLAT
jgi:hypothetical protein